MRTSEFLTDLYKAYQAELDDLRQDSKGKDVLKKRLADKRGEIDFLVKMMALSPEMVAVVFHQAFVFDTPAVMDDLLGFEADELPDWSGLAAEIQLAPWAQPLAKKILSEPDGKWFLTVAALLEYMYGKPALHAAGADDGDDSEAGDEEQFEGDAEERADAKARKEAAEDWMVGQGFDRKE